MAKKQSSPPISTNLSASGGNTNLPWTLWFTETGRFLTEASASTTLGSLNYTLIGQICHISYDGALNGTKIKLPYTNLYNKKVQCFIDGSNTPTHINLAAGSSELIIATGTTVNITDCYFARLAV